MGLKRRDGYIRCPKCKQLLIPLSPLNKVPTHPARLTAHAAEPYWWDGSPTRPPTAEQVRQWCAEQEAPTRPNISTEETMPDACPHCGHPLRNHHVVRPVYDRRAWFRCACACEINGSVEARQSDGSEGAC